jgi:predicted ATP-dependent endonuclease of OLD family
MLKDRDFVTEVAWMGHGLQMWLQTMWFLARAKDSATIILDEPDVYMHADLQRKLIRLIRGRHEQVIVATHSVEIMAEVSADDILIVNRTASKSIFASKMPDVQEVIQNIGSIHNIQLARLWSSRKCLLVEGEDITFLKLAQNVLFPQSTEPFDALPNIQLGGWSGWHYAIGSKMLLKNAVGEDIIAYCIFDSDYHTPEEIEDRMTDAQKRGVQIHIWHKKEIENYFLIPETIQRVIANDMRKGATPPTLQEVSSKISEIIDAQKFTIFNALAKELFAQDKAKGITVANEKAQQRVDAAWTSEEGKKAIVSGKAVISGLSRWSHQTYGVILNATRIIREMRPGEVESELARVITAVEKGRKFTVA